jgi:gliding motility-associated-like protein
MKKIYLLVFTSISVLVFSQKLIWHSETYFDPAMLRNNAIFSVATDDGENLYAGGTYSDKIGFASSDPTTYQLTGTANSFGFIYKLNKDKDYIWSKSFDSNLSSKVYSLNTDSNGDIIVTGYCQFQNTFDLNPDPLQQDIVTATHSGPWTYGAFVVKLDKDGVYKFGNFYEGVRDGAKSSLDSENNIITFGNYLSYGNDNVDFDSDPNATYNLQGTNGSGFILKNDKNGNFKWAVSVQGHYSPIITSLKTDSNGSIVLSGRNENYFQFENLAPYRVQNSNTYLHYLCKIDKNGNFKWFQYLPSGSLNYNTANNDKLDIDEQNNIVLICQNGIEQTIAFSNKSINFEAFNKDAVIVLKMDENKNYIWHSSIYESGFSQGSVNFSHGGIVNVMTFNSDRTLQSKDQFSKIEYLKTQSTSEAIWLRYNLDGKLIYNKSGFPYYSGNHSLIFDKKNDHYYYTAVPMSAIDLDPDQDIVSNAPTIYFGSTVQKLSKCYTGTPDGDSVVNYCSTSNARISNLYPMTSYTTWYDSPTSTIPLSNDTILEDGKDYYASVTDASCGINPTRLKVRANVIVTPDKPNIQNQYLCNMGTMRLQDLFPTINPNNLRFSNNVNSDIPPQTLIVANSTYTVYFVNFNQNIVCKGLSTTFTVYSTAPKPIVSNVTELCPAKTYKIKDIQINGQNIKWYDSLNNLLDEETILINGKKYFITQTINSCESQKAETTIKLEDKTAPIPNIAVLPTITGNCKTVISTIPTATDVCMGNIIGTTSDPLQYSLPGNYVIAWNYDDGNGNISTQNQNVTIISEPLPIANAIQTFCKIDVPKISNLQIAGTSIKWYDAAGNALNTNTLLTDGTKYFATQTLSGCESAKFEITVALNDTAPPTGNIQQDFCSAQNPNLSNLAVSGTNVKWYDSLGNVIPISTPLTDGETYYATQTVSGCESTKKLAVKVSVANGGIPAKDHAESICNDTVSTSKIVDLNDFKTGLIANTAGLIFEFYTASNQLILNPSNVTLTIGSNEFNVKISNTLGCFVSVKLNLTLNPKPVVNLPANAEFCNGQSVTLDAGAGFSSYEWTKDSDLNVISTSQTLTAAEIGKYTVTVTNAFNCKNSASVTVTKSPLASITGVQIVNNTATVQMSETGDFLYSLDNRTWQISNIFSNLPNGNHTVYVKTSVGCVIGQMNFTIFNVNNSFSPNGDGKNDTWKVGGLENYPNSEITVLDRWGNAVLNKVSTGSFEWDGKLNSRPLPTGNYWYQIKVSDGRILNGWLLIKNRN